jgi:Bacterial TSP3 repeat
MDALVPDSGSVDSDGDGLSDFSEQTFKTNPFQFDSDGDGVNDATELQDDTDPLDPSFFLNSSITSRRHTIRKMKDDDPSPSPSSSQSVFLSAVPSVSPSSSPSASPSASCSQTPSPDPTNKPTSPPHAAPTSPPRKACDHLTCKACRADPYLFCYWSIDTKKCIDVQLGHPFPPELRPKPKDCLREMQKVGCS